MAVVDVVLEQAGSTFSKYPVELSIDAERPCLYPGEHSKALVLFLGLLCHFL